jgi:hypothetical protein
MAMSVLTKFNINIGDIFKPMLNGKFGVKVQVTDIGIVFSKNYEQEFVGIAKTDLLQVVGMGDSHPEFEPLSAKILDALGDLADKTNSLVAFPQSIYDEMPSETEDPAIPTELVDLRNATQLYQPVRGTSTGSVYLVAALGHDLSIAMRVGNQKLSVRVEGNVNYHKAALNAAGLKVNDLGKYASAHLSTADKQLAMRTVGAMLMAPGIVWTTPLPDFEKLWMKGVG